MFRGVLRGEDTSLDVTSSPQRTPRIPCPVVGNGILEAGHRYMWGLSTGVTLTWWVQVQNNYCPVIDRNSDFFWNAPIQSCIPRRLWYWLHIDWCMLGLWKPQVGSGSKQNFQRAKQMCKDFWTSSERSLQISLECLVHFQGSALFCQQW